MGPFPGHALFHICFALEFRHCAHQQMRLDGHLHHWLRMCQWRLVMTGALYWLRDTKCLTSMPMFLSMPTCSPMRVCRSTSDHQAVSDDLVESLVVSGNEATVAARFTELLAAGLDELMVSLVPTAGAEVMM